MIPAAWLNARSIVPAVALDEIYRFEDLSEAEQAFPEEVVKHWSTRRQAIRIPAPVAASYERLGRPTPLTRASNLERHLGTAWEILLKREDLMPNGSFKICSAIPQAYFGRIEGRRRVVTETGAGQTGAAAALASALFGLSCEIFMVATSYRSKPLRRRLMELYGATVHPSPSEETGYGRNQLTKGERDGTIAMATSEVLEVLESTPDGMNIAGSLLDFTLTYNTIIGLEAIRQLRRRRAKATVVVGSVGGGSSFGGLAIPFLMNDAEVLAIAAESTGIPTLTRGRYDYDHPDGEGAAKPIKMYSLGYDFKPPPLHASGLRYHAAAPVVSYLVDRGRVQASAIGEKRALEVGRLLARLEGIVAAPESSYALAAALDHIDEHGKRPGTIVCLISGSGVLDLDVYAESAKGDASES